jgi:hypothetical protein
MVGSINHEDEPIYSGQEIFQGNISIDHAASVKNCESNAINVDMIGR